MKTLSLDRERLRHGTKSTREVGSSGYEVSAFFILGRRGT
jgi:hypothetical protein